MNIENHFIAVYKDRSVLQKSSSGGMFTAFAKHILNLGGIIFGATYDSQEYKIKHISIESADELSLCRKSKYVYSEFVRCFPIIEKAIEDNRYILFTGTPCQAEAIRKKYSHCEKLFVVDLFCHGTIEPQFFFQYLEKINEHIIDVDFRGQSNNEKHNFMFRLTNDKQTFLEENYDTNYLTNLFVSSAGLRKTCFSCSYSAKRHSSDITIGDWNYEYPEEWDELAKDIHPSIVAINTDKGKVLFSKIKTNSYYQSISDNKNVELYYPEHEKIKGAWGYNYELREQFDDLVKKYDFMEALVKIKYPSQTTLLDSLILEDKKINCVIYGAGVYGQKVNNIINTIYKDKITVKYFVISNNSNGNKTVEGLPVKNVSELIADKNIDLIFVAIRNKNAQIEIFELLRNNGICNIHIIE